VLSFAFIFRGLVLLLLAAHVFYMYCTARGMGAHFGFDSGTTIGAALFALAMLVPLVWAVFLPDVPEVIAHHVRPRRRWRRGECPHCGYDRLSLPAGATTCPECGGALREPEPWRFTSQTVRRFVAINLLAWLIGCFGGEAWMLNDEHAFRGEIVQRAAAGNSAAWSRARRWPNDACSLVYEPPGGFGATD
jgi:hypothetical protein